MFRRIIRMSFGVALAAFLTSSTIVAVENRNKTTYFTFNKSVQLPGVTLAAGAYIFEVVNPHTGSDVVTVLSRDRSKVYLLRITNRIERPRTGALKPVIVFGEARPGNAPPITAWFPDGETTGREFIF